jgi:hypothetical protein
MKVAPMPRTSGIIADWLIRTKLPNVKKLGLMVVMITHRRTRTMTGAHEATRQRRARRSCGLADCSCVAVMLNVFSHINGNIYSHEVGPFA